MRGECLRCCSRKLAYILVLSATALAGCNRTPGYGDDDILKQVGPLGTAALMPFDIEEFNVTDSGAEGKEEYVYEFELKGKFRQTLYGFVDPATLSAHGSADSLPTALEYLREKMPAKHVELENKLTAVAPGGVYYVLVCKQGEPCVLDGLVRARKTDGKWRCTSISITAPKGSRGAGLRYVSSDGTWKNGPELVLNDPNEALRGRIFLTASRERAKLFSELPPGAATVDIDSPTFNERAAALLAISNELKQLTRQIQEISHQAEGEMRRRLRELTSSAWTFEADTPAGKRKLQLEATHFEFSDDGSSALFDVELPMRRQYYGLKFVQKSGLREAVDGVMFERCCWEGRALGFSPEVILGTEHEKIDRFKRPAAFRLFVEKEGYTIEVGGKHLPLAVAKSQEMLKRVDGVHPGTRMIERDIVWIGTVTGPGGKSLPVKANVPETFNGIATSILLEFGHEALAVPTIGHDAGDPNGWYARARLPEADKKTPLLQMGRDFPELKHLEVGLRFEAPEQDRWIGYSRDGKYRYEFTSQEKLVKRPSWKSLLEKIADKELDAVMWRGDVKTDVRVRIVQPPAEKAIVGIRDAADEKKLSIFQGWIYSISPLARNPNVADAQPNPAGTTPLTSGKQLVLEAAPDEKTIYGAVVGPNVREGIIITVP